MSRSTRIRRTPSSSGQWAFGAWIALAACGGVSDPGAAKGEPVTVSTRWSPKTACPPSLGTKEAEACLKALAILTGEAGYCRMLSSDRERQECVHQLYRSPEDCVRLAPPDDQSCKVHFASRLGKKELCRDLSAPARTQCVVGVARILQSDAFCQELEAGEARDQCWLVLANERREPTTCAAIDDAALRVGCNTTFATQLSDPLRACSPLGTPAANTCLEAAARQRPGACAHISQPLPQAKCFEAAALGRARAPCPSLSADAALRCASAYARVRLDPTYCDQLTLGGRDACRVELAKSALHVESCLSVAPQLRAQCAPSLGYLGDPRICPLLQGAEAESCRASATALHRR